MVIVCGVMKVVFRFCMVWVVISMLSELDRLYQSEVSVKIVSLIRQMFFGLKWLFRCLVISSGMVQVSRQVFVIYMMLLRLLVFGLSVVLMVGFVIEMIVVLMRIMKKLMISVQRVGQGLVGLCLMEQVLVDGLEVEGVDIGGWVLL